MYFVYVLQSQKISRFYIGITRDLDTRLEQHNAGSTRSTKSYRPWRLIDTESYESKTAAAKREWYLKHPVGYLEKKAIVEQNAV